MTRKMILTVFLLLLTPAAYSADSETLPVSDPNPYINLYLQRTIVAEANIKIAIAKLDYEIVVLDMYNKTNERSAAAIPLQEILKQETLIRQAEAVLEQAKSILAKEAALWKLAKFRIAAGDNMPICIN